MIARPRLALAFASLVVLSAGACSRDAGSPAEPTTTAPKAPAPVAAVEPESVDVCSIKLGDCLSGGSDDESVSEMQKLDCAAPHVYEVYHVFDLPAGDFPGDEIVDEAANSGCSAAFTGFIGKTYDESKLEMQTLTPQQTGWITKNDREVICMVVDADEVPRTGSARGAGI